MVKLFELFAEVIGVTCDIVGFDYKSTSYGSRGGEAKSPSARLIKARC